MKIIPKTVENLIEEFGRLPGIGPKTAVQLVALLPGQSRVQGKKNQVPYGKTPTVSFISAGLAMSVNVYAVDEFYNLDPTCDKTVWTYLPNDEAASKPGPLTLDSGATTFGLTPIVAGNQVVVSTGNFDTPVYTSENFMVHPDTEVAQIRLQMLFSGETVKP